MPAYFLCFVSICANTLWTKALCVFDYLTCCWGGRKSVAIMRSASNGFHGGLFKNNKFFKKLKKSCFAPLCLSFGLKKPGDFTVSEGHGYPLVFLMLCKHMCKYTTIKGPRLLCVFHYLTCCCGLKFCHKHTNILRIPNLI